MKSFLKLLKVNYRNNYIGYIIIGILLLIPTSYCAIQTYNLYDAGYSIEDVKNVYYDKDWDYDGIIFRGDVYSLDRLQKEIPTYVGDLKDGLLIRFTLLNLIVIFTIFILSRRNRTIQKFKVRPFTILSLIVYGGILSLIEIWFDSITIIVRDIYFVFPPRVTGIFFPSLICSAILIILIIACKFFWKQTTTINPKGLKILVIFLFIMVFLFFNVIFWTILSWLFF